MMLFFMFLLAGTAIAIAVLPLVRPQPEVGPASYFGEDEVEVLRRKKEIVYGNIKDLEFEYRMNKLGEDDYQRLRNELKLEAALLMEQMERAKKGRSAEDIMEAEIAARRARIKAAEPRCPKCQTPYSKPSKFCSECGSPLQG